jgi:hypothetical protein
VRRSLLDLITLTYLVIFSKLVNSVEAPVV